MTRFEPGSTVPTTINNKLNAINSLFILLKKIMVIVEWSVGSIFPQTIQVRIPTIFEILTL